jgi:hypothetical protein
VQDCSHHSAAGDPRGTPWHGVPPDDPHVAPSTGRRACYAE